MRSSDKPCGRGGASARGTRPLRVSRAAIFDLYIKGLNAMPGIILAPIFGVWSGLGMASKVALGVTLVFFVVSFNGYQGVREVSPVVLANARMLGASPRHLLRHVYLPSALSWVFASRHNSAGLAFVGAVVGEYLGSAEGVGYLILQAEGVFDINTRFRRDPAADWIRPRPGRGRRHARETAADLATARGRDRAYLEGAARRFRGSIQGAPACEGLTLPFSTPYNPPSLPVAGWSSLAARRAHNPKVIGSNPIPATNAL